MRMLDAYLGDDEQVLLSTRQHPVALVRALLDTCIALLPLALLGWGVAGIELLRGPVGEWTVRAVLAWMLLLVLRLGWRVVEWELERVVITTDKVLYRTGVLSQRVASTPLGKLSEFTVRQSLAGRILGYGALVLDVPGGRAQVLHGLGFLPDPAGVYRLVCERSTGAAPGVPAPTAEDLARLAQPSVDPWQPQLPSELADHTIEIPRIPPRA